MNTEAVSGQIETNGLAHGDANQGSRSDHELDAVFRFFSENAVDRFGRLIRQGTDEVIATARTRRWSLDQCNNQEKAYLGVNIENLVRRAFDLPEGRVGMDFDVEGVDVDAKWSRSFGGWQIPQEAEGHICLLVHGDDLTGEMAVGLLRVRADILVGGNQDKKRTIQSPGGISEIRWLVGRHTPIPENFLMGLRKRDRDAILAPRGGNARASELFKRCEGIRIHRHTIEAIGQQSDGARRFRGETRAALLNEGFEVLNGHWKADRARALALGGVVLKDSSEWVCLRSDGSSAMRRDAIEPIRVSELAQFRREFKKQIAAESAERLAKRKEAQKARQLADFTALIEFEYDEERAAEAFHIAETSVSEM